LVVFFLSLSGCNDRLDGGDSPNDSDDAGSAVSAMTAVDDCGYPNQVVPAGCDGCHGMPPVNLRHPTNHRCQRCHGYVIDSKYQWVQAELHANGEIDVAVGCTSCHGWKGGMAPPQNLRGECGTDKQGVGSHEGMRRSPIMAHRVNCINCHKVPTETWQTGHIDGDGKVEVKFAELAVQNGAKPSFDGKTCSNVYCHGATLEGGTHKTPTWGDESGKAKTCGACHRLTDPQGNADADCHSCHPTSLDKDQKILEIGTHMDGTINMPDES
jgi:predicted CxxxxCH...CXXCH cytochrome family protein